jgi:hypothetical protein
MVFQLVLPSFLSRLRRNTSTDSSGSDPENDTDTEVRRGEFGAVYATEPDAERAPTSRNPEDVIDEIAREVDERRRRQPVRIDADDVDFEFSGEEADLADIPPRRWRRRRLSLSRRFSTFSSVTTSPSWWQRFKHFVWPPNPDFDELVPHYRLTPIVSGIVVPFSLLLEIPGLTEHWYIRTEGNSVVETRPNSSILEAGLAVSIFSGLVANVFLVMRFLEIRVKTMTILSVLFLSIHGQFRFPLGLAFLAHDGIFTDVINITALSVFGTEHRSDDGFTYGQAFWMTLCSTIASLLTNFTLIYDLYSVPNFEKSGARKPFSNFHCDFFFLHTHVLFRERPYAKTKISVGHPHYPHVLFSRRRTREFFPYSHLIHRCALLFRRHHRNYWLW